MNYADQIVALYEPLLPFVESSKQDAVRAEIRRSADAVAALAPVLTEGKALGDGAILQLLIMLFKELLPILLELLKDD